MVVEMHVFTNEVTSLGKSLQFYPMNTLCFENREEIFCQSIVIWIPTS